MGNPGQKLPNGREASLAADARLKPDPADDQKRIDALANRVLQLEVDVRKLQGSWLSRFVVVVGIVGGLLAIPKTAYDGLMTLTASPKTDMRWGDAVGMHYDQASQDLVFTFDLTATNEGLKTDHVSSPSVELGVQQPAPIYLGQDDIRLAAGGAAVPVPFSLSPGQSKDVQVTVTVQKPLSPQALEKPGRRTLEISLFVAGKKGPISHRYFIPPLDNDDLMALLRAEPRRSVYPIAAGGGIHRRAFLRRRTGLCF